jgi:hypothetical protein
MQLLPSAMKFVGAAFDRRGWYFSISLQLVALGTALPSIDPSATP